MQSPPDERIAALERLIALALGEEPTRAASGQEEPCSMERLRAQDITLTGDRVVLRPMTEEDWPLILSINNDPEVGYFTEGGEWQPYSLARLQHIYRGISEHALMFVIEHAGQAIGECWLQRMNVPRILDEFPGRNVRRIDIAIGAGAV